MKKLLSIPALLFALLFASQAQAVGSRPSDMTASGAIVGTQLLWCPTGITADLKCTFTQVDAFINAQFSGDLTVTAGGVVTLKNTGPGATGPLGSATVAPIVTIDAQGRVTALTSATVTPAVGSITGFGTGVGTFLATPTSANLAAALTDETGTGAAVFATAPTIGAPIFGTSATFAYAASAGTQCAQLSSTGALTGTGSACGAGGGAVSSVTAGTGITVSPTTGAVVVSVAVTQRNNTTTSDTIVAGDAGTAVTESNASAVAVAIAQAGTTGFASGQYWTLKNKGAGLVTLTPTTSTIDGAATLTLKQNQSVDFYSDGTNYITLPGRPTNVACADVSGGACLIASGTAALGTSAIASAACATVVTATATGTATTDVVTASFNGDPTAVTGYIPATAGMLTIITYPTANTFNAKVCNNTSSSITPGAITLNWRVVR